MANKAAGWLAGADWGGLVVVGNILLPSRIFFLKINNFHSAVAIYNLYSENHKLFTLDTYTFCQITTIINVPMAFVFGLQTL